MFAIRLLFGSSSENNVIKADELLHSFCEEIVSFHSGNERIEKINVHCLQHFADQVRRLGPLYFYSAMSFEAANGVLGDLFTGSHSESEVICRRILQRHRILQTQIDDPKLNKLFWKLSGSFNNSDENYDDEFVETQAIRDGRKFYPEAKFFNRVVRKNIYYDCEAYKRSQLGNCYAWFAEENKETFGQIEFFFDIPDHPIYKETMASIKKLDVVKKVGLVEGYFYSVSVIENKRLVPVSILKKVFLLTKFSNKEPNDLNELYITKLCSSFDHS